MVVATAQGTQNELCSLSKLSKKHITLAKTIDKRSGTPEEAPINKLRYKRLQLANMNTITE